MTSQPPPPRLYDLPSIERVCSTGTFRRDLVKAIASGFAAFERGHFSQPPIQTLGAPPLLPFSDDSPNYAAQTCVKSGYFRHNPYYVVKVASGGSPFPTNSGSMQVYSQSTGRLVALLLDEGILTELRTAAVGASATQLLLVNDRNKSSSSSTANKITPIGMLGTGVQARYQLELLQGVVGDNCRNLVVYGRTPDKVRAYATEMTAKGWDVEVAAEANDLLRKCELVITTTTAREPVLGIGMDQRQLNNLQTKLIVCIGSDAPGKGELDPGLIERADMLVADSPAQSLVRGEFQCLSTLDPSKRSKIVPLGRLVVENAGDGGGDNDSDDCRLVIFDSSGMALQDCVIAQMVYEALNKEQQG